MSLPVSQYEALLAEVRGLRRKAQRVQQLATPLISNCSSDNKASLHLLQNDEVKSYPSYEMDALLTRRPHNPPPNNYDGTTTSSAEGDTTCSEDECGGARSTHMSVSSEPVGRRDRGVSTLYHGTWPVERTMWNSEPTPSETVSQSKLAFHQQQDVASVMSFASSSGPPNMSRRSSQQLEAKVDMVYSLLAMLSGQEHADMGETLLALSANPESCLAMRQSGCVPLLVQMVQSDREAEARRKATQALHNLVHSQPDEKLRKREVRIFKLLEHTRAYAEALRSDGEFESDSVTTSSEDDDRHPVQTVAHLMKLSFDELHRQAICTLGGIHAIADLVEAEHAIHGSTVDEAHCILMRRYACMALTNLTFGDGGNKALLCTFRDFMRALVVQLQSPSDELRQVTASVLRNLSWRADSSSKEILREVGSVTGLMKAAMLDNKENTLKSILSALWNLSAHCTENKSEICSVEGALGFLVDTLTYKTPSKSLAIIENSGGILRNISSQIAVRDDYREILRRHGCLQILLDQLKSASLTIVSNACGTLWNLSAKCPTDQEALWQMGAPAMLRSLNHSKHKMIAMGSSAALKNLLSAKPTQTFVQAMDSTALAMDLPALPTLGARKQKALLQDLDQTLSETYENIERDSPVKTCNRGDFVEKIDKNNSDFSSVNLSEPSTSSFESSLPHVDDAKRTTGIPTMRSNRCFVKNRSKSCSSDSDSRSFNNPVLTDSGLQSLESPKVDEEVSNDRCKKRELKLKEISVCSDEKDRCSIEDVSDSDNQSVRDDSSYLVGRREASLTSTPSLPLPCAFKYANLASSNVTMFEGDIDEIDMEDISIHFAARIGSDEDCEKRDVEKEKKSHLLEVTEENLADFVRFDDDCSRNGQIPDEQPSATTKTPTKIPGRGIPLPRSSLRPIPLSSSVQRCNDTIDGIDLSKKSIKSNVSRLTSGLPRRSLTHSTPIKIGNARKDDGSSETAKVQHITDTRDRNDSLLPTVMDTGSSLKCSLPTLECFSDPSVSDIEQVDSRENSAETEALTGSPGCLLDARERLFERSCEDSNPVDNRMLDPDAMIESLERFTAELVSQASHLQQSDDKYKDNNTWNEDTSPNEFTFPSISGSAPNVVTFDDSPPPVEPKQPESNDFSSTNNTSTMTESTLIAIEASKMAKIFKDEAEMTNSVASLELDEVQPPSLLDSLPSDGSKSSVKKKKSLPRGLMVRRALSNSLNNGSSLESLENHSLSNLDRQNPPSAMAEVFDMEGSIVSVASLPSENAADEVKIDFLINGSVNERQFTNLESINPPSIFTEITDLCNSLADVATEAIGSETEIFEDCVTHVPPTTTTTTEDEVTEFSDANSGTPIQSDLNSSSPEASPKKTRNLRNATMTKQRRNLARDRYKTYTVAAEMVMRQEEEEEDKQSSSEDFKTVNCVSEDYKSVVDTAGSVRRSPRLTPKERRQQDRSRFETRVVEEAVIEISKQPIVASPTKKNRENFLQKRLANGDRFKTQTLTTEIDLQLLVQKEADLVVKSLRESKTVTGEELLDCETLSLVSNDDDSERNTSPVNYRTYHKSWGLKRNIPVIEPAREEKQKPKIVKPPGGGGELVEEEAPGKAIRGRRKPLYSKTPGGSKIAPKTLKPVKTMTSTVAKNATSIKSAKATNRNPVTKPPVAKAKLERQGTFTKEEAATKSRIPTPGTSKIPAKARPNFGRSTSADSRETTTNRRIQSSVSSQSLKTERPSAAKKSAIPHPTGSPSNTSAKKQVTSKIASLWKKIEESKNKQPAKKDTRVWIQSEASGDTFDNKDGVTMRGKTQGVDPQKRVSRLGSFIVMEDGEQGVVN